MIEGVAALAAWLGASTIVLADGRLGLAAGMALSAAGLGVIAWQSAGAIDAAVIFAAGILASALRLRAGTPGWNIMPPGSTARLVMCVASGVLALWVAATVVQGPGVAFRFAAMTTIALPAARILATDDVAAATTAAGLLLLAVAVASAVQGADPVSFVAAALVATGAAWWPRKAAARAH